MKNKFKTKSLDKKAEIKKKEKLKKVLFRQTSLVRAFLFSEVEEHWAEMDEA